MGNDVSADKDARDDSKAKARRKTSAAVAVAAAAAAATSAVKSSFCCAVRLLRATPRLRVRRVSADARRRRSGES